MVWSTGAQRHAAPLCCGKIGAWCTNERRTYYEILEQHEIKGENLWTGIVKEPVNRFGVHLGLDWRSRARALWALCAGAGSSAPSGRIAGNDQSYGGYWVQSGSAPVGAQRPKEGGRAGRARAGERRHNSSTHRSAGAAWGARLVCGPGGRGGLMGVDGGQQAPREGVAGFQSLACLQAAAGGGSAAEVAHGGHV